MKAPSTVLAVLLGLAQVSAAAVAAVPGNTDVAKAATDAVNELPPPANKAFEVVIEEEGRKFPHHHGHHWPSHRDCHSDYCRDHHERDGCRHCEVHHHHHGHHGHHGNHTTTRKDCESPECKGHYYRKGCGHCHKSQTGHREFREYYHRKHFRNKCDPEVCKKDKKHEACKSCKVEPKKKADPPKCNEVVCFLADKGKKTTTTIPSKPTQVPVPNCPACPPQVTYVPVVPPSVVDTSAGSRVKVASGLIGFVAAALVAYF
ncbi:Ubiquitin-activating enzyme E1-like protein [Verticillium dahliae VDG1]|nr:Ubiquitin-activating enzyme E1-like protein [Verticillium dahliae VDG1]